MLQEKHGNWADRKKGRIKTPVAEEEKKEEMERVDYSALSCTILHFKQLVDLSSQACRCSSDSAAVPAVI